MYKSVTLIFPGQGSQHIGMGKKLEGHKSFEIFNKANEALEYNLSKLMFEGPMEELTLTQNTQPAIISHSVGLFQKLEEILKSKNIKIDRVLGHSVGEYAALVAAGALSAEDAIKAVHLRGKYMQEAVPAGKGKMYAIMRTTEDMVKKACEAASEEGSLVMPANFNEPGQTVISGEASACERAVKWLEENVEGRFRATELKVSAPFHSSLMEPAAKKLEEKFGELNFKETTLPYVANINAKEYASGTDIETVKKNLVDQVCGSVLWSKSIADLPSDTLCIEVGPGKILAGLVRKINRDIKVISLDNDGAFEDLEELL